MDDSGGYSNNDGQLENSKYKKAIEKKDLSSIDEKFHARNVNVNPHVNPQPSTSQSQSIETTALSSKIESLKNDLLKESKTYPYNSLGLKSTQHGIVYQLKLLMLIIKRCHDKGYIFKLATEMKAAKHFDDVVLEFINPNDKNKLCITSIALQAKHIQNENEKSRIKAKDLQTISNKRFSLQKYFKSYQKIEKSEQFIKDSQKYFIIYTNTDFKFDNTEYETLKKLDWFYFETFKDKLYDLFNVEKSEFYKLVGLTHKDEREKMVTKFKNLFEKTSDFNKLAKALAEHLIKQKDINFKTKLFKEYHSTLVNEIIDIKNNKLREEFINLNSDVSSEVKVFREVLLQFLKKKLKDKDDQTLWNEIGQIELKLSKGFKKNANLQANNPTFPSPKVNREEIEGFINNLIFAVNQPNEKELGKIINKEIGEKFNLIDSELVTHDFQARIFNWLKGNEGRYLKNEEVNNLFNGFKEKVPRLILIGPTVEHINKLQKTGVIFKSLPLNLVNFLNQTNNHLSDRDKFCHLDTENTSPLLGSVKVYQVLKENKEYSNRDNSFISLDLKTLLSIPDRVLNAFKKIEGAQLLIVECNSNKKIDNRLNELKILLDNSNQKRLLLIGSAENALIEKFCKYYSNSNFIIKDESHFKDLTEDSQEHVLKSTCKFQEYEVVLNQLFEKTVTNVTNSIILAELLDNEKIFKIGKPIQSFGGYHKNYFIERTFWQKSEKDPHKSDKIKKTLNDLLEQSKQNTQKNFMMISDVAGMGKSTMLTHLSHELKKQSPDHWIVKFELSKHTDALKEFTSFTPENDVIDFISNNILNINTPFEKKLFKYLFGKKKVGLLLDAFNEISPNYENTVLKLLKALNITQNQLWVTTRPNFKESYEKKFKDRVMFYNLEPFSENDQIAFLAKFWTNQFGLQDEVKIKKYAEELLKKFTRSIRDNEFTGIPLQTRMLAEAFQTDVKTFNDSSENEPEFIDQFVIFECYEKFYRAKFDLVFQKGKIVQDDMYKIINEYGLNNVYSNLALLMLFPKHERFLTIKKQNLLSLQIGQLGIAEIIDCKEIQFIHRTFAEYSAAEYFSKALTNYNPKSACNYFLKNVLLDDNCQTIRYFLDRFLKNNSIPKEYFEQYGEQIDKTYKDKNNKTILHIAAREGNSHIVQFLTKSIKDNYKDTLKSLIEKRYNNQLAWHEAAKEGHVKILKLLWKLSKSLKLDLKTILLSGGIDRETAWIQASKAYNFVVLEKLWQWAKDLELSRKVHTNLLLSKDSVLKRNALHFAIGYENIEALQTLQNWATEIQCDLLLSKDKYAKTVIHLAAESGNVEVLKMLRNWTSKTNCDFKNDFLLSKDNNGRTAYDTAKEWNNFEVAEILKSWET